MAATDRSSRTVERMRFWRATTPGAPPRSSAGRRSRSAGSTSMPRPPPASSSSTTAATTSPPTTRRRWRRCWKSCPSSRAPAMTATTSTRCSTELGKAEPGEDEPPPLPASPTTRTGRALRARSSIACSAAMPAMQSAYRTLLGEERADLLWTDPPYGVDYQGKTKAEAADRGRRRSELADLLAESFAQIDAALCPRLPAVRRPPGRRALARLRRGLPRGRLSVRQTLVWVKDSIVLGHLDYHYRHEQLLYGFKPGEGRLGRGGARLARRRCPIQRARVRPPPGLARAPDDEAARADRALPAQLLRARSAGARSLRRLGLRP